MTTTTDKTPASNDGAPSVGVPPLATGSDLTRAQWLDRCAAQFRRVCDTMPPEDAMGLAESQLENLNDDLTESPERAADDEMSYWGAD